MSPRTRGVLLAMSSFLSSRGISNAMNDYMTNYRTVYQMFGNSSCREHSLPLPGPIRKLPKHSVEVENEPLLHVVICYMVSFGVRPVYPKLRKEGKGRSAQYER